MHSILEPPTTGLNFWQVIAVRNGKDAETLAEYFTKRDADDHARNLRIELNARNIKTLKVKVVKV